MRVLVLLLLSLSVGLADTRFSGSVADSAGTSIANAMILIHWDSAGSTVGIRDNIGIKEDLIIRTQVDGALSVDLPPGFYDVFTAAKAFTPTCREIRVKVGTAQEIKVRLKPDLLYTEEMGNRVEAVPHRR